MGPGWLPGARLMPRGLCGAWQHTHRPRDAQGCSLGRPQTARREEDAQAGPCALQSMEGYGLGQGSHPAFFKASPRHRSLLLSPKLGICSEVRTRAGRRVRTLGWGSRAQRNSDGTQVLSGAWAGEGRPPRPLTLPQEPSPPAGPPHLAPLQGLTGLGLEGQACFWRGWGGPS